MKTIGRNDPCPCGSGKKYKKCCGETEPPSADRAYERLRRLDAESDALILAFSRERYGREALTRAWKDFWFDSEAVYDRSHYEQPYFERWFLFDWQPDGLESLAAMLLDQRPRTISQEVSTFIEATLASPYTFLQVLAVEPGVGFKARDVLCKREISVTERIASGMLQPGNIVLARVVEMDGISFLMGCAPQVVPALMLDRIIQIRTILEEEEAGGGPLDEKLLLNCEEDCRETYFMLEDDLLEAKPSMRNTDGDPLSFQTLTYETRSAEETFDSLRDLEEKASGRPAAPRAKRGRSRSSGKVTLQWFKRAKDSSQDGLVSLASLTITGTKLVVEVNSAKRSKRIQNEIAKRLGDHAVLLRTETLSLDGMLKQAAGKRGRNPRPESEHDRLLRESPEVRAMIKEMHDKHWASWPDIPVPALLGMTPRAAVHDPEGRELLESLLLEFERGNNSRPPGTEQVDVDKLRRELGI
jgi:hypothetical protein